MKNAPFVVSLNSLVNSFETPSTSKLKPKLKSAEISTLHRGI